MGGSVGKPVPEVTEELRPFFTAAREGRLVVQSCARCGRRRFPPRPICNQCLSRESRWVDSTGRGQVVSFNVMHQIYHPGFAAEVPYAVVLVELDDGGRMLANLVDCSVERLKIGMPVEVTFESRSDVVLPQFRPRG
jgi:uncharacterized OB-fold protein